MSNSDLSRKFIQLLPGNSRNQRGFMRFDRLELVCKDNSLKTRPKPSVTWRKNNQLIKGENKNTFVIPVLDVRDSGAYECRFENYVGSGSRMYVLVVEHAPVNAELIRMDAKHTSKLICSGDGVPRPTKFEWDIRTEGCMKGNRYNFVGKNSFLPKYNFFSQKKQTFSINFDILYTASIQHNNFIQLFHVTLGIR